MILDDTLSQSGCGCDTPEILSGLTSIDTALEQIATYCRPIEDTEFLPLDAAQGRVLAEPVFARGATPPFDASAMDGYALASSSLTGPAPWSLTIVDEIPAGSHGKGRSLMNGETVRIFTGAPLPLGADTVVIQEQVERRDASLHLDRKPVRGENIRRKGEDMSPGTRILDAGKKLGPRDIAALAAAGAYEVRVRRKLRIALIVTGNEIRGCGDTLAAAEIRDVNRPMLRARFADERLSLIACERVGDDPDMLSDLLSDLAGKADIIVTTGGISVGDKDYVKPVIRTLGADIAFSGVAIKPGKPVTLGKLRQAIWLGLPGNPVSALTTWDLFGQHVLVHLCGQTQPVSRKRHVVSDVPLHCHSTRCEIRPARLIGCDSIGRDIISCDSTTHSARVAGLPKADGYIFIPAGQERLPANAVVEFLPFSDV